MPLDQRRLDTFLRNDKNLKFLDFSTQNLSQNDLILISRIITRNPHISRLCLSNNRFSNESIRQLAIGLSKNKSLRALEINNCGLACDDLIILADALAINQSVISLSLANNYISYTGIKYLTKLQSLEALNISGNANIGPGAAKLINLFKNLLTLDISNNKLTPQGLLSLASNNQLMKLDIRDTGVYSEKVDSKFFEVKCSLISLNRTLIGDIARDQAYINFIKINKNAMLERYKNFINIVILFACHYVSFACQNDLVPEIIKQPDQWSSLPLDMHSIILKYAAPFGKMHIGLNSLHISEKIDSVYQSTFQAVRRRRQRIESATRLTTKNIERWKNIELENSNIFELFSNNEGYIIPDFLAIPPESPIKDSAQAQSSNSKLNSLNADYELLIPPQSKSLRELPPLIAATTLPPLANANNLSHDQQEIPTVAWGDGDADYDSDSDNSSHDDVDPNFADIMLKSLHNKENQESELKRTASASSAFWYAPNSKRAKSDDNIPVNSSEKESLKYRRK